MDGSGPRTDVMPWNALKTVGGAARGSDGLHVVGWQHPCVASALHGPIHPAIIDLLHIDDGVPILEGDLVLVSSTVVIHCAVPFLGSTVNSQPGYWM